MKRNTEKLKANAFKKSSIFFMILIVFVLPAALTAVLMQFGATAAIVMLSVSLGLLAVYVAVNIIGMAYMKKHRFDFKKERENIFRQKELLNTRYDKLTRQVRQLSALSYLYTLSYAFIMICLNTGVLLLWTVLGVGNLGIVIVLAVAVYLLPIIELILLYAYFAYHFPPPGPYIFLGKEEYPEIWGLAERARQRCNVNTQYVLLAVPGSSAAISLASEKLLQVVVGIDLLPLLTPEELFTVLVHEFSHASNRDTTRAFRVNNRLLKWQLLSTKRKPFPCFLFMPLAMRMFKTLTTYVYLTSYNLELKADKKCLTEEDAAHSVNALAKIDLYEYYMFKLPNVNSADIAEGTARLKLRDNFIGRYAENKEEWEQTCKRQLPARLDTHPNLAERMKNLGKDTFDVNFTQTNEKYIGEIAKLDNIIDDVFKNSPEKDKNRKYGYDIFVERTQKESDGAQPGLAEGYAYFRLCDYDKALDVYSKVLEKDIDNPEALFYKSIIECDRNDTACIDGFLKLLDVANYFEASYITLVRFVQYMALAEKREELREYIYAKADFYSDIMNVDFGKCGKSTLPPEKVAAIERAVASPMTEDAYLFGWRHKGTENNYLMISFKTENEKELDCYVKDVFFTVANECPSLKVMLVKNIDLPKSIIKKMNATGGNLRRKAKAE